MLNLIKTIVQKEQKKSKILLSIGFYKFMGIVWIG